ncbi:hypothetical protein WE348_21645 (plasmid) [Alteromonas macleodii]|uniref:hypothetical protein n=1 Tax=Alteromonas macleodii TaxID=28108 RepID=UPI0030CB8DF1
MKVFTTSINDLNADLSLSPHDYVKLHEESRVAYWRRLERLYRCDHLPHLICEYLDITSKQFVDDLKALYDKGIVLSNDTRKERDFESRTPPSKLSKVEYQRLIDDETFYSSKGISIIDTCRLMMITLSRWKHLENAKPRPKPIDTAARNKAIVEIFSNTENKRGLKSRIASSFGISRKMIDLILEDNGINSTVGARKQRVHVPTSKKQSIIDCYDENIKNGTPESKIVGNIARTLECTTGYVYKILKENDKKKPT